MSGTLWERVNHWFANSNKIFLAFYILSKYFVKFQFPSKIRNVLRINMTHNITHEVDCIMPKKQLMIDLIPACGAHGFPKALPEEAVIQDIAALDYHINPDFDLTSWILEQGYQRASFTSYRTWLSDEDKYPAEDGGVENFI